jgi:hypothetical protein
MTSRRAEAINEASARALVPEASRSSDSLVLPIRTDLA